MHSVNSDIHSIFYETERICRLETSSAEAKRKIDIPFITNTVTRSDVVCGHYHNITVDSVAEQELLDELLQNLIELYVRVRAFSFAKDTIQKYKKAIKEKKSKGGLRNNMKKNSDKSTAKNSSG